MKIALDYDNTYTKDTELWDSFIAHAKRRGHEVTCVTMRRPEMALAFPPGYPDTPLHVIYTSMEAKARHYQADIWIDDDPKRIFSDFGQ
jgi:hypothetical protein